MTGTKPKGKAPSPKARPSPKNRRKRKDTGMSWRDSVAMCVKNLFRRKVRTVLTVSGVIIGTCAITVMISLGIGMQKTLDETLAQLGDLTIIQIYNYGTTTETPLDDSMLEQIRARDDVVAVTPVVSAYSSSFDNFTISSGRYTSNGQVTGVDFNALKEMGYSFDQGGFPEGEDMSNMIVFGPDALYNWMDRKNNYVNQIPDAEGNIPDPYVDVMKDKIELTINRQDEQNTKRPPEYKITCTGVFTSDWEKNPAPNYSVFMDVHYLQSLQDAYNKYNSVKVDRTKVKSYDQVIIKVADMNDVEGVEEFIQGFGFQTSSMESVRKPIQDQANQQQMILGSLGAISLFVAALSITNTMIMSVYERTREIGVMKVLGCSLSDIRGVFLLEAGCIGFIGGVIGVVVSYVISFVINRYGGMGGGDMSMGISTSIGGSSIIPWWLAIGAVAFATLVGLVSGFSPANRAVKISALTAIKQE